MGLSAAETNAMPSGARSTALRQVTFDVHRIVAIGDVLHERCRRPLGDVVDHDAAGALQADEGVALAANLADG